MARLQKEPAAPRRRSPPARTPEERENELTNLAVNVAEEQLIARTASSQVITHFLKLATVREQLEREKLQRENALLTAKAEALATQGRIEEMYKDAIHAIRKYQGHAEEEDYDD